MVRLDHRTGFQMIEMVNSLLSGPNWNLIPQKGHCPSGQQSPAKKALIEKNAGKNNQRKTHESYVIRHNMVTGAYPGAPLSRTGPGPFGYQIGYSFIGSGKESLFKGMTIPPGNRQDKRWV